MEEQIHGVLPDHQIRQLIDVGILNGADMDRIQPGSIDIMPDLNTLMKLKCFTLPKRGECIKGLVKDMRKHGMATDCSDLTLETNEHYLVRMNESFEELPYFARANPKSSIGRIFMHSRLLCDKANIIDEIPTGHTGDIWMLLRPKFFPVTLSENEAINQVRFFSGDARLSAHDLRRILHYKPELVTMPKRENEIFPIAVIGSSIGEIPISVDLKSKCYRTRTTNRPLCLDERAAPLSEYYEEIDLEEMKHGLILEEGRGYLIGTREQFQVPDNMAIEVIASDRHGEIKPHFAGFGDPNFGLGSGNSVTLEIVCYERDLLLRHGQYVGTIRVEWMASRPERGYSGNYVLQPMGAKAPKYVK